MGFSIKSFSALIIVLIFSFAEAEAQFCMAHANWTFDPPPVNGMLELGATVEICVDLDLYSPSSSSWLSGLELDFPPAWDLSTLNVVSIPSACSGNGEWVYLDTLVCEPHHFGPGFYYDANLDGNFCNNYGDACAMTPENMTFCFTITLAGDCPTDEENLFPRIRIISDDYFADFPSPCPNPIYVQPDLDNLSLNCCGAQSGTSPGTVALCESQCLFDLLEGAQSDGVWTGPAGYTDSEGCGFFDVNTGPYGDYTYTVGGAPDCSVSSTITVIDTNLGVVGEAFACAGYAYLNEVIGTEYPTNGTWYNPSGEALIDGIADFSENGTGIYSYEFYSESGCPMTLGVEVVESYTSGESVSTVICENSGTFCPFEVYQSLQAPGIDVSDGGSWIVYDELGNYQDFLPVSTMCLEYSDLEEYSILTGPGSSLYFQYLQGSTQCGFSQDTLTVIVGEYSQGVSATACAGIIDLEPYLPPGTPTGGYWTNYNEFWESVFDCTPCAVGSTHNFLYTYELESGCTGSVGIDLVITGTGNGGTYTVEKCGDGSMFNLYDLTIGIGDSGGMFSPSQMVVLLPQNSGIYTYTTTSQNCGEVVYSFNLTIDESLAVTNPITMLVSGGISYIVTFTVTGGVPPYLINGIPIAGDTFTSSILPLETQYNFSISDAGSCSDIDVIGEYMPPCTVSAGESPGEIDLCQYAPFCLFDELINADTGGVWTGPAGWADAGCGLINPSSSPPGDYYYIVSDGAGCADTSMITLVPIDLGVVQSMVSCGASVIDFNPLLPIPSDPVDGYWMVPGYPQILDTIPYGLVDTEVYPSGIYTYTYYDDDGCLTTLQVELLIYPAYLGETAFDPVIVCGYDLNFSPAVQIGLTDSGPTPPDGNWIVYDSTGTIFLGFLAGWDVSLTGEYLLNLGSSLVFKYIFGPPPCTPYIITLPVVVSGGVTQVEDVVCQSVGAINLYNYVEDQSNLGGSWNDQSGAQIPSMIDISTYEPGSVHIFYYNTMSQSGCTNILEVWLTILEGIDAGDDYQINLCGNGEMIDMHDLLPSDIDQSGTFPNDLVLADPSNSGVYFYTVSAPGCPDQFAIYTLTFTEPFTSAVEAECNPGGTSFNVTVEVAGGMPPYAVNGEELVGNSYEASGLAVADGEAVFVVEDDGLCDAIEITIGVDDTDGDGICDDQEIIGCMDPTATNYNPNATNPGSCFFEIGGQQAPLGEWIDEPGFEKPMVGENFGVGNSAGLVLDMRIFPNPTGGQDLNLEVVGLTSVDARIEICDLLGSARYRSVLASADGAVLKKIDLDGFASGVYLIRLIDGEETLVHKIIVTN